MAPGSSRTIVISKTWVGASRRSSASITPSIIGRTDKEPLPGSRAGSQSNASRAAEEARPELYRRGPGAIFSSRRPRKVSQAADLHYTRKPTPVFQSPRLVKSISGKGPVMVVPAAMIDASGTRDTQSSLERRGLIPNKRKGRLADDRHFVGGVLPLQPARPESTP